MSDNPPLQFIQEIIMLFEKKKELTTFCLDQSNALMIPISDIFLKFPEFKFHN